MYRVTAVPTFTLTWQSPSRISATPSIFTITAVWMRCSFDNLLVPSHGSLRIVDDCLGHGMSIRDADAESFRVS
jgi:hypothetical protein